MFLSVFLWSSMAAILVVTLVTVTGILLSPRSSYRIAAVTIQYWCCLAYFWRGGSYKTCPYFTGNTPEHVQSRVHLHSLWLISYLWNKPHYRNGTFRDDMVKNLRNVAVPGTGLPLSLVVQAGVVPATLYIWIAYPIIALVAAVHARLRGGEEGDAVERGGMCAAFEEQLLRPKDWFSFWRLNCRLASYHALVTGETGYECEDKWTFLTRCEKSKIPISPCLQLPGLVCKHRNEEGGLGFCSFVNAHVGGDWIIQEALHNADWLADMLPKVAPLSTMRVITSCSGGLRSPLPTVDVDSAMAEGLVDVCSCVLRAGRSGALTDHVSILFDVDPTTGVIKKGTTSAHWYKLGPGAVFTTPWTSTHDVQQHPDNGVQWEGRAIPDFAAALELVKRAHLTLSPGVPMIGWDVAFTTIGVLLLEANYSCNFFRGTFDQPAYFRLVDAYMNDLEGRRMRGCDSDAQLKGGEHKAPLADGKSPVV